MKHARRKRVAASMVIEGFPGADDAAIHVVSARFDLATPKEPLADVSRR
jgi:hypothetical protein